MMQLPTLHFFLLVLGFSHGFSTIRPVSRSKCIINLTPSKRCENERNEEPNGENILLQGVKSGLLSAGAAATIVASTITCGTAVLGAPANANALEISSGAFVVESKTKGETLLKSETDSKSITDTIFKNRKELLSSFNSIQKTIGDQLSSPAWVGLSKEFLQYEGNVPADFKVLPPPDMEQAVKDIQNGKLNILYNGDIINLVLDQKEDELVIRVVGFKGMAMTEPMPPAPEVVNPISESWNAFWNFWHSPIPEPYSQYLPDGVQIDTGGAILSGSVLAAIGTYAASYAYYMNEIGAAEADATSKKAAIAAKKAAKAEKEAQEAEEMVMESIESVETESIEEQKEVEEKQKVEIE